MAFSASFTNVSCLPSHIDADEISQPDLSGGHQIGQREHDVPLDGALQVPCAIFRIGPLLQQEALHFGVQLNTNWFAAEAIRMRCCTMPSSMSRICSRCSDRRVLKTTDLSMRFMNSGREFAPGGFDRGAIDLVVEAASTCVGLWRETQAAIDQVAHLARPQVRGHDDDALRKIDAAVVAQGQGGFVQNAQQQLPERSPRPFRFRRTAGSRA